MMPPSNRVNHSFVGCYEKPITYIDGNMTKNEKKEVPLSQIVSLIQISESCQQSFTFDCTMAPFTKEDIDFSFWEDRNGGINNYFTGKAEIYQMTSLILILVHMYLIFRL